MLNFRRLYIKVTGAKGKAFTAQYDIINISLMEAALKNYKKFRLLKDIEDAVIEIDNATDGGGSYLCFVPLDNEILLNLTS